ncbi:hypothetical protein [Piscinibacter sp. XHJ-5]|uniref:hypothetical protein n=1 Tax=Piscinibacter sp. XHJ-5 TaxID=3037797 RepID=UPI00245335BA|nr:hypothetical protein [Piscinibacter sp. XHJ-5]
MAIRLLSLAVLAVAAGTIYALRKSRSDFYEPHKAKPEPEQRWEGEGGALPATGAQMGPDPAVTTAADEQRTTDPARSVY